MSKARKRIRLDATKHRLVEEQLPRKDDKPDSRHGPILPLKNGGIQMEAGWARAWEKQLRDLSEIRPAHFKALHSVVEGRASEVSKEHKRDLRKWSFLLRDGSPHPYVQAIMTAGYRETGDGPCLVDPLDVQTPKNAVAVQRFDEQREERQRQGTDRLVRELLKGNKDSGKDRAR